MSDDRRNYIDREFDNLGPAEGPEEGDYKLKINSPRGATKWLSIADTDAEIIRALLVGGPQAAREAIERGEA